MSIRKTIAKEQPYFQSKKAKTGAETDSKTIIKQSDLDYKIFQRLRTSNRGDPGKSFKNKPCQRTYFKSNGPFLKPKSMCPFTLFGILPHPFPITAVKT